MGEAQAASPSTPTSADAEPLAKLHAKIMLYRALAVVLIAYVVPALLLPELFAVDVGSFAVDVGLFRGPPMAPPRPTEVSHVDDAIVDDIAIAADEEEEEATSSSREEEELGARVPSLQHPRRREAFDEKLHPRATYSGTQDLGVGGSIVLPHQIVEQQHATLRKIKEQQRQHAEGAGSQAAGGTGGGVPNRTPLPYPVGDSGLFVGRPATTVRPPGPFGRRLTSNTTEPSVRLSIDGVSPVHYGGIVARRALSLIGRRPLFYSWMRHVSGLRDQHPEGHPRALKEGLARVDAAALDQLRDRPRPARPAAVARGESVGHPRAPAARVQHLQDGHPPPGLPPSERNPLPW
jgi:hypothetical protein